MSELYQEVGGARRYFKYSECKKGQVLVDGGIYLRTVANQKYRTALPRHEFECLDEDGSKYIQVLNGSGQLNYKMEFVEVGSKVKIVYEGKIILDKGPMAGKESCQFKVFSAKPAKKAHDAQEDKDISGEDDFSPSDFDLENGDFI